MNLQEIRQNLPMYLETVNSAYLHHLQHEIDEIKLMLKPICRRYKRMLKLKTTPQNRMTRIEKIDMTKKDMQALQQSICNIRDKQCKWIQFILSGKLNNFIMKDALELLEFLNNEEYDYVLK